MRRPASFRWGSLAALATALALAPSGAAAQDTPRAEIVAPVQLDASPVPYPEGATGEAVVVLELEIEKDGTVGRIAVREGAPPFADAARTAAEKWRFTPATRNGLPIRARVLARVHFQPPPPPPAPEPTRDELPRGDAPGSGAGAEPTPSPAPSTDAPAAAPLEVTVLGEGREELGSTHIPRNEIRLVPGAFADPFRVVEVMPGVAPILSGIPYFTVRGAPPSDVGYVIDGLRVPLLFHVGAGPSVLAPALVDRVDLYPSVYPARLGRAGGGIMAGETTPPSTVARGEAQARIFDAGGMAEQPFASGNGSALVGGRYGYTGALLSFVAPDYSLQYWDYQARLAYRVSEHERLSAFSFGAYDFLRNEKIGRTLFNVEFHRLDLRWDRETDGGRMRLGATLASDKTLDAVENARDQGTGSKSRGARIRFEIDQRMASGVRARGGADVGVDRFDVDRQQQGNRTVPFPAHTDVYGGAYLDFVTRPAPRVELVPGFRFDLFRVRDQTVVAPEPRLASRVGVASGIAWISALGVTHQVPTFVVPIPGSNVSRFDVSSQEVWQASEAIEAALPWRLLAKATAFRNVVFLVDGSGRQYNHGIELFLRRDFTERLGGFVSYTLSRADRYLGNARELSTFDRPHVLSVVLGYDLGKGFRAGGRYVVMSGRPYELPCPTPECVSVSPPTMTFPYLHSGRFPAFSRLDVRFEKKWRFDSGAWIAATFEWFNALLARELDTAFLTPQGIAFTGRSPLTLPSIGVEAGY
jgi:TonB family protein